MQETPIPNSQLPEIPSKRYFTIGEVSELCSVKSHVLRYWEQEFPSLKPMKRRGNRRYYQREDVILIRQIRGLLYEQGYTISGARQQIMGAVSRKLKTPLQPCRMTPCSN
ncbi:MAG: MerR family transcriptional regulator [Thiolinea sp.]